VKEVQEGDKKKDGKVLPLRDHKKIPTHTFKGLM
jgi:hypothetical protein